MPAAQAELTSAFASVDQPTIASPKELSVDTARGSNNPTASFILVLRNATHCEKKGRREKADMIQMPPLAAVFVADLIDVDSTAASNPLTISNPKTRSALAQIQAWTTPFVRHEILVARVARPLSLVAHHLPAMHKARVGWTCRQATAKLRSDCNGDRVHQSERGPQSSVVHLDQSGWSPQSDEPTAELETAHFFCQGSWRKSGTRNGLTLGLRGAGDDEGETTYSRVASDQISSTTAKDDDDGDYGNDRLCLGFWSLAPLSRAGRVISHHLPKPTR
ncbi:predicted protein [Verticillium alfalfae VaMs.102]|uniref:Predicted protein n=1 Tax=Verticillium alfalfae (strain VaMs.102 / ATCC MYA-4576 / FGSC 10136) TaxID=526221 RepID=C9S9R0_VERA1|nr:predicted protein [Verticillium alfalfae VaMs.102]EEY16123.1 predicted protein [Verticillium alfalfae VaMs.102]